MEGTRVASRYAKSFIDLSMELGALEKAITDMNHIASICKSNPDFVTFLKSPVIKTDKKLNVLNELFAKKLDKTTFTYITLITNKKREMYLPEIAAEFLNQYNAKKNILKAVVTSANGLDDAMRKKIMDLVKEVNTSEVVIEEKINKDIIGGIIIRVGDKQIDASIARKLNELKRTFKENPFIKEF